MRSLQLKSLRTWLRPLLRPTLAVLLACVLLFSSADAAWAARSGGRIGGGSFRAPRPSYSQPYRSPSRSYQSPRGYYPGGGYGFGFPFLVPFFGFGGGGGLFGLLIFFAIASFLVRTLRSVTEGDESGYSTNPKVSVARLQIGLLAKARHLQDDLNQLATSADTSSAAGLSQVLQESTLSLLRHPEYWAYADTNSIAARLTSAETEFNRLALTERSKFSHEAVSNVNNQLKGANQTALTDGSSPAGDYIIATLIVATQGQLSLPDIQSEDSVRTALNQIGAVPQEQLMAVEVLWTPQASGETLTADEVLALYPNLKLV